MLIEVTSRWQDTSNFYIFIFCISQIFYINTCVSQIENYRVFLNCIEQVYLFPP